MKISKKIMIGGLFAAMIFGFAITTIKTSELKENLSVLNKIDEEQFQLKSQSSLNNYDIIQDIFDDKNNELDSLGRFLQIYEPSLQATYYALYTLQAIDKLNTINQTTIKDYILSNYNNSAHFFMDIYAYRYLDSGSSGGVYYPLTTILEVNCYAILSLEILNQLNLIDKQNFVDFIWSCYNPITSGFIGQPYSPDLNENFKISTLDNTYFAIKTLNVLTDWNFFPTQKSELASFINKSQSTDPWEWKFGGFLNDNYPDYNCLYIFEPNLLSCYYAIKSLEIFNLIEKIDIDNFHQYLSGLYSNEKKYFRIAYQDPTDIKYNDTNLAATAIGLELSILTNYIECDQNGVVNFLLNHRNLYGTWNCSTENKNKELIDTFEIIRGLNDMGKISKLTANDKTLIANTIQKYFYYNGFSLISDDYMSLNLIYTIVNSFNLYDKIADPLIECFYNRILNSCIYHSNLKYLSFYSCVDFYSNINYEFRSKPIEYYTDTEHKYLFDNNKMISHKSTFYAIDSLKKLNKLDDLDFKYKLNELVSSIINSQFLDSEYENYGAFLPSLLYQSSEYNPKFRNGEIEIEYSYYAIKALEILSDHLKLGKVKDLGIDNNALYTFINRHMIDLNQIYFNDNNYDNVENRIQKTYYMLYILKSLELFSLDYQKIINFVEQNLDYSNIRNIYYSWKISKLLNLSVSFNLDAIYNLTNSLYNQNIHEFYITSSKNKIVQESFQWICEMAKEDNITILCNFKNYIQPGSKINITVILKNIVLNYFGSDILVKYKSEKLGGETLLIRDIIKNTYSCAILIPNDLYQIIEGFIYVYYGPNKLSEKAIIFHLNNSQSSPSLPISIISEADKDNSEISSNNQDKRVDIAIPLVIMLMAFPAAVITISYKLKRDSFIKLDKK